MAVRGKHRKGDPVCTSTKCDHAKVGILKIHCDELACSNHIRHCPVPAHRRDH